MGRTQTSAPGPLARGISAEIRASMARKRISGNQLAKEIGISQNYLAKRLRDEAPFNLNDLDLIAEKLGLDLPALIAQVEEQISTWGNGDDGPETN